MLNIEFANETKETISELKELKKLIRYAIKYMKLDNIEFGVIMVDNKKIRELNKTYRNIDRETDVITFRLEDYEEVMYDKIKVLGDIYISIDKARSQSIEYGHSYLRELSFLLIHGFLHLLGYDHMNSEDEKEMFELQEEILNEYGIKR
jgi:probable rRNA maturation factor